MQRLRRLGQEEGGGGRGKGWRDRGRGKGLTLTRGLKRSWAQISSVVLLVVGSREQLSYVEQQLAQAWQQVPPQHIQLEVLQPRHSSVDTR